MKNQNVVNVPSIGMGVTIYEQTNKLAATIVDLLQDGKKLILQEDKATRTDKNGMSGDQEYSFKPDVEGKIFTATLRKDGSYKILKSNSSVVLGERKKYFDFNFSF